ncbi:MAG: hypothetical protein ACP5GX_09130 [Anaerolineae bacterium]
MTNLLKNPGFEEGSWHRTRSGEEYDNIAAPEEWIVFWREGGEVPHDPHNPDGYRRPECRVISAVPPYLDPMRIHGGDQAWQCFTFFGIHDAGIYQQVEGLEPGVLLRASAWVHAWSSRDDNPHTSSVEGDEIYNFTQRVGIDPLGGTDPWADTVVWSDPRNYYDEYQQLPSVETVAQSETITVFLRSEVLWRFKHCDVYWDDVALTVESDAPGPNEPVVPGPGGVDLTIIDTTVLPEAPKVGDIFKVVVHNAAPIAYVRLVFEGGEVLRGEPQRAENDISWRCMALSEGHYIVKALAGNTLLASASFDVAAE